MLQPGKKLIASVLFTNSLMIPRFSISPRMFNLIFCLNMKSSTCFRPWTGILDQEAGIFAEFISKRAIFEREGMPGFDYQMKPIGHEWKKIDGIIDRWFFGQDDIDMIIFQQAERFVGIKRFDLQQDVGKFLVKFQQDRREKNGKKNRICRHAQSPGPPFVQISQRPASLIQFAEGAEGVV